MSARFLIAATALAAAAAAPSLAQDEEPNPSLARLAADRRFGRVAARSLKRARIGVPLEVRIDTQGRVVILGYDAGWSRAVLVARLLADGSLDPGFGTGGVAVLALRINGSTDVERGLAVDAAGRIVVTGNLHAADDATWEGPAFGAVRLTGDGALDTSFAGDGMLELAATGAASLGAVGAAGADGTMIAAAVSSTPGTYVDNRWHESHRGFVRIAPDGTIDAAYGESGFASIGERHSAPFAVDADGGVIAPFVNIDPFDHSPGGIARLDADGVRDLAFGTEGFLATPGVTPNWPARVAIDGLGRIVVEYGDLWRFLPGGAPDATFSGDGHATHAAIGIPGDAHGASDHLAIAPGADCYVLAGTAFYRGRRGFTVAHGFGVQRIDPSATGAVASYADRRPGSGSTVRLTDVAVDASGTTAIAVGIGHGPAVLRVNLTGATPLPMPDLRITWIGAPDATNLGGGDFEITGKLRVENTGEGGVTGARVSFDVLRDVERTISLRGRSAKTLRLKTVVHFNVVPVPAPG